MKIFDQEKQDGISDMIRSNASIAYASPIMLDMPNSTNKMDEMHIKTDIANLISKASAEDSDVFRVFSILVSTNWNKNDDVFAPGEVWSARNTPLHKPTNLEHDEKKIVGNIIGNWVVDDEYSLINEVSEENLPDSYNILVASVIYRQWQDPEYKDRAEKLISEIKEGQKAVSMECIFRGFDYAVQTPDGQYHIVPRDTTTAFLSKHLKAYGGTGEYQEHRIARLLRKITFSGKGYVANPANPKSIIFSVDRDFPFSKASIVEDLFLDKKGVSISMKENPISNTKQEKNMSDYLEKQVADLQEALEAVKAENKELSTQLSEASVEKYEAQIKELNDTVANLETEKQSYVVASEESGKRVEELQAKVNELEEALAKSKEEMDKMKKEKMKEKRMAALVEAGVPSEDAEKHCESFANLSDEQFEVFAGMMKKAKYSKKDKKEEMMDESEGSDATEESQDDEASQASDETLESAQANDNSTLNFGSDEEEDSSMASLREGLNEWAQKMILPKNNK